MQRSVRRPTWEGCAAFADFDNGQRARFHARPDILRAREKRHNKEVIILAEGDIIPIRRNKISLRLFRTRMGTLIIAEKICRDEGALAIDVFREENP